MNRRSNWLISFLPLIVFIASCAGEEPVERDLINDPFPGAQAELREVVDSIAKDVMSANIEGLQGIHLNSSKFTKFGPRSFSRQDVTGTNESEAAFFSSVTKMNYEIRELKIDVFGDVGIATYYPHVTFVKDGEEKVVDGRQTLVFLNTENGWKIVHEHGTIKK